MNEEEAWRMLMVVFSHRTGVCSAITALRIEKLVSPAVAIRMRDRIEAERKRLKSVNPYLWDFAPMPCDGVRFQFCERQAKRAKRRRR